MKKKSFTLIELLLVIGVIAILSGILLPALSKAKERVKTTVCLGNVRQLYLGALQYANNFDGFMYPYDTRQVMQAWTGHLFASKWAVLLYWPKYWVKGNMYCPSYPESYPGQPASFYATEHFIDPWPITAAPPRWAPSITGAPKVVRLLRRK